MSLSPTPQSSARVLLPALALALGLAGCEVQIQGPDDSEVLASGARQREAPRVRVSPLEQREMVQVLETTTVLESEAEILLLPRISGRVLEVLAEEGDHVEAGAILARIDDRDAVLAVRDAEVALDETKNSAEAAMIAVDEARAAVDNVKLEADQAERDYERNQRLFAGDEKPSALSAQALETSQLDLDKARHAVVTAELAWKRSRVSERDARTSVSRAEVALSRAKLTHEFAEIRAPFQGVIASRSIRVGDTVGSEAVFTLTDTDNLRAILYRPQRELSMFAKNGVVGNGYEGSRSLEITAEAEALPGFVFRGVIQRTSPTVDADSGSFRVTAGLDTTPEGADSPRLLPGMLVRLRIVTDRHPGALVAPKRAIRREADQSFVMVVEDELARRVDIDEGFSDDDSVEIVPREEGALVAGALIVTVGARDLADESAVQIDAGRDAEDDLQASHEEEEETAEIEDSATDEDTTTTED